MTRSLLPLAAVAAVIAAVAVPAAAQYPWPVPAGIVCQTPVGWCGMVAPAPVGSACACPGYPWPVAGVVR